MLQKMINFFKDAQGATMVEYALMVGLIAAVCVGAVMLLGGNTENSFTSVAGDVAVP